MIRIFPSNNLSAAMLHRNLFASSYTPSAFALRKLAATRLNIALIAKFAPAAQKIGPTFAAPTPNTPETQVLKSNTLTHYKSCHAKDPYQGAHATASSTLTPNSCRQVDNDSCDFSTQALSETQHLSMSLFSNQRTVYHADGKSILQDDKQEIMIDLYA